MSLKFFRLSIYFDAFRNVYEGEADFPAASLSCTTMLPCADPCSTTHVLLPGTMLAHADPMPTCASLVAHYFLALC